MRPSQQTGGVRRHLTALNNGVIFSATYKGVSRFPRALSYGIGYVASWMTFRLMQGGTNALLENFRAVFPDRSPEELTKLALLTYRSYARDTIDFIRALSMDRRTLWRSIAHIDRAVFDGPLSMGKGLILAGGHFGNWELGGVVLRRLFDYPLAVTTLPEPSAAVNDLRRQMRESLGVKTVEVRQAMETALHVRRLLGQNHMVAMLMDRHVGRDRVEVQFFGRRAYFLRSPAAMASFAGAPLLPSFLVRQPDGRFLGVAGDPIRVGESGNRDADIGRATQQFATVLEGEVRRHPHLWYQFYPYWAEQPQVDALEPQRSAVSGCEIDEGTRVDGNARVSFAEIRRTETSDQG